MKKLNLLLGNLKCGLKKIKNNCNTMDMLLQSLLNIASSSVGETVETNDDNNQEFKIIEEFKNRMFDA